MIHPRSCVKEKDGHVNALVTCQLDPEMRPEYACGKESPARR